MKITQKTVPKMVDESKFTQDRVPKIYDKTWMNCIYAERGAKIHEKMMRCRFQQSSQKFLISCKIKRTEEALCPER